MHARGHGEELKLREGGVAWQEVDGETVLLDLEHSHYLGINAAGTLMWRALAAGTTRGEASPTHCAGCGAVVRWMSETP